MTKDKALNITKIICIACIILGIIFLSIGFYKVAVYENSEYSWDTNVNAYVGGDAYNYIINGTHFTAYSVLSGCSFVIAAIMGAVNISLAVKSDDQIIVDELPEI